MWSHGTTWHSTIPSAVRAWFDTHPRMMSSFLIPLSSTPLRRFSEPGDGTFLTIVHRPKCPSRMQWMLHAKHYSWTLHGWIRHTKDSSKDALPEKIILCDVDENMWPNAEDVLDSITFIYLFLCGFFCLYINITNDSYIEFFSCILFSLVFLMSCCK